MLAPFVLLFLHIGLLASASPVAPAPPPNFQIRVWRQYKAGPPYLDANPQIDNSFSIVNRTLAYPGFLTVRPPPVRVRARTNPPPRPLLPAR